MSSGFPSDVLRLLCLSASFILAELSPKTTRCCSCTSVYRKPSCCFQEPPWITELRQSSCRTSEGKPEDFFFIKYDPILLKCCFVQCMNMHHWILFLNLWVAVRAVLKNWYGSVCIPTFIFVISVLYLDPNIYFRSPCQNPTLKFNDKRKLMHYIFILTISVCPLFQCVQLKCKSALKFHFSCWYFGICVSV